MNRGWKFLGSCWFTIYISRMKSEMNTENSILSDWWQWQCQQQQQQQWQSSPLPPLITVEVSTGCLYTHPKASENILYDLPPSYTEVKSMFQYLLFSSKQISCNKTLDGITQGATKVVVLLSRTWVKCRWTSEPSHLLVRRTSGFEYCMPDKVQQDMVEMHSDKWIFK